MVLSLSRESETALGTRAAAALSLLQTWSPRGIPCRRHVYRTISKYNIYTIPEKRKVCIYEFAMKMARVRYINIEA